ncbi:MAG: PorT family protein [Prevotella sp.]|nr:PorT family protein [Prevotella sp.]
MKKFFTTLVLFAALLAAVPSQAQVKFGVRGGLNITDMSFDEKVFDTSNRLGFYVGPTVQVALPLGGLGVDIAALYDQKESKVNDYTIKQQNIVVPVNLRLKLGLASTAGLYLAAGPQFGFNIGDDKFTWKSKSGALNEAENTFQLKKSNFSVNLGAGVYLTKHLEVGFTYNIAMGKTADASFKDAVNTAIGKTEDDTKAKTWTITAAFLF